MPISALSLRLLAPAALALTLAACGGGEKEAGNTVALKDMEVVDGTASDAMTDLDGVRAEGTAMIAGNGSNSSSPAPAAKAPAEEKDEAAQDAEVVADQ